ncbi:Formin_homology 2 domain-containing protein [Hexamita inflata]|nr:Formin homology 2 domain-containing protein [Hexamita inflata]
MCIEEFAALCNKCKKNSYNDQSDAFNKFYNQIILIKQTVSSFEANKQDNYEQIMQKFVDTAEFQVEKVLEIDQQIKTKIEKTMEFFAESKNTKFEEFVQYFYDFAQNAQETLQQLKDDEINELKRIEKEKKKDDKKEQEEEPIRVGAQKLVAKKEEKEEKLTAAADGLMDGLMQGFINAGGKKRR